MRRFSALLSILGLLSCMAAAGAAGASTHAAHSSAHANLVHHQQIASHPAVRIKVAPADEYFGRLKMSILGIRNTFKDLALRADSDPTKAEQIFGSAAFAEEALRDWEHKYPRDPWLAKSVAALVHMYTKVPTAAGRSKMHAALAWLTSKYGSTAGLVAAAKAEVDVVDKAATTAQPEPAAAAPPSASTNAPANANPPAPAALNPPAKPPSR